MNTHIFREYDIRGIFPDDLTQETVSDIGRAFAKKIADAGGKRVAIGRDCRNSSDAVYNYLIEGIMSSGINVVNISTVPTPVLYYGLHSLDVDGGIMITGSHNPPEYNGLKVCIGKEGLYGRQIQELAEIIEKRDFIKPICCGKEEVYNLLADYREYLYQHFSFKKKIKIVVDCGNGTGSIIAGDVLNHFNHDVTELFCVMDGNFPNHHPDPTVEKNLTTLIEKVKSEKADLGIAFDGDADRLGAVDEYGRIIWGDELLLFFAMDIIEKNRDAKIIGEVKCSMNLYNEIKKAGAQAIMWKAGHSLIKARMKEEKSVLAGEMSGHLFFADRYFGYDDAVYSAMRLVEILSNTSKTLGKFKDSLPRTFSTPEIRIDCPEDIKFRAVELVTEHFRKEYSIIDIDGVRVSFENGWGLLRPSNTQPVLVMRFEAYTPEDLDKYQELFARVLNEKLEILKNA